MKEQQVIVVDHILKYREDMLATFGLEDEEEYD